MYDFFQGVLAERVPGRLVIDAGGVGYVLAVPLAARFEPDADQRLKVWAHLVVREDAQLLYGFPDRGSRELFRGLLKVKQVGPSAALALLSGLSAGELVTAIRDGDTARLCSVKGIGKKTAEQILLDLRDRVGDLPLAASAPGDSAVLQPTPPPSDRRPVALLDAEQALMSIGYSEKEARKAVDRAAGDQDPAGLDSERLIRDALRG